MNHSTVVNFDDDQADRPLTSRETAIRRLADQTHRLNHAITLAVEAGVSVEMLRCSRYHSGAGHWGDQMQPIVTVRESGDGTGN